MKPGLAAAQGLQTKLDLEELRCLSGMTTSATRCACNDQGVCIKMFSYMMGQRLVRSWLTGTCARHVSKQAMSYRGDRVEAAVDEVQAQGHQAYFLRRPLDVCIERSLAVRARDAHLAPDPGTD